MEANPRRPRRLPTALLLVAVVGGLACISTKAAADSPTTNNADSRTGPIPQPHGAATAQTRKQDAKDAAYIVEDRGASAILERLNRLRGKRTPSIQEPAPSPQPAQPRQPQPEHDHEAHDGRREQWSDSVLIMVLGTVFALLLSRCQAQAVDTEMAEADSTERVQDARAKLEIIKDSVQPNGAEHGYETLLDKARQVQRVLEGICGITLHPDDTAGRRARRQVKDDALLLLERILQAALALAAREDTSTQMEEVQGLAEEAGLEAMRARVAKHLQNVREREELRTMRRRAEEEQDPQRRRALLEQCVERARHAGMLHEVGDPVRELDQLNRAAPRPEMVLLEGGVKGQDGGYHALEGENRGQQRPKGQTERGVEAAEADEHSDHADDDEGDTVSDDDGDAGGGAARTFEAVVEEQEEVIVEEEEDMVVVGQGNNDHGNRANALAEADPVLRVQRDMIREGRGALEVNEVGFRMRQLDDHRVQLFMHMWREQREDRHFIARLRQDAERHRQTQQQQRDTFKEWMSQRRRELDERLVQERNAARDNHLGLVTTRAQDMRNRHTQAMWRSAFLQVCTITVLYVIASWRHHLHQQHRRAEGCPSNPLASTGAMGGLLSWGWMSPITASTLVANTIKFSFCTAYTTLQGWYNVGVACVLLGVNTAIYLLAGKALALVSVVASSVLFASDGVAAMFVVIVYPLNAAAVFDLLWYLIHERLVSRGAERAKEHVRSADITSLAQCLQHMEWHLPRVQGDLYHLINDVMLPIVSIIVAIAILACCLPYSVLS